MNNERILSLFYNQIVKEASNGRVDCFLYLNLTFSTTIDDEIITINNIKNSAIKKVPRLIITNKEEFDELLVEYVNEAIAFYDQSNFKFLEDEKDDQKREDYLIKYIICTLFANSSISDFMYPNQFLKKRIEMLHNKFLPREEEMEVGYLESIGASLHIKEEQSPIKSETPYRIKSYLEFDDEYILELPSIYAGRTDNKYYLYGIQGKKKSDDKEKEYIKRIRKGFIAKYNGAPEHYLFTFLIFISLCNESMIISPFLIERINGSILALERKYNNKNVIDPEGKWIIHLEETTKELYTFLLSVYSRLTTYFTKLESCTTGLNVNYKPFIIDDKLHATIDEEPVSKVEVLNELFELCKDIRKNQNYKKMNIVNN